MVKLSLKGAQDPADSSLQMKVITFLRLRLDNTWYWAANCPPSKNPTPKSMLSDCSLATMWSPNPNSGTTCEDSSKPRAHRDRFFQLMRYLNADPIM